MAEPMSMKDRWAADEELAEELAVDGKSLWQPDPTKPPRWVEDDLGPIYGPGAPRQDPPPDDQA